MATPYFHKTGSSHSNHSSMIAPHTSHSYLTAALAQTESRDSQSDINVNVNMDDDVLRYNKRLKARRDTLLEDYIKLEQDNKKHCDVLRELLKPFDLTNKHKRMSVVASPPNNKDNKDKNKTTKMIKGVHSSTKRNIPQLMNY